MKDRALSARLRQSEQLTPHFMRAESLSTLGYYGKVCFCIHHAHHSIQFVVLTS